MSLTKTPACKYIFHSLSFLHKGMMLAKLVQKQLYDVNISLSIWKCVQLPCAKYVPFCREYSMPIPRSNLYKHGKCINHSITCLQAKFGSIYFMDNGFEVVVRNQLHNWPKDFLVVYLEHGE
jgi:hypothetical protein